MRATWTTLAVAALLSAPAAADDANSLGKPVRIEAGGKPIDVEVGHAAPFVGDFDGDGLNDLLVGQFGDGKLRIYRNTGTNAQPRYGEFQWFTLEDGELGKIPSG